MPVIAAHADWDVIFKKLRAAAPEAFTSDGRVLNLIEGEWREPGFGRHYESAIDGRSLGRIPMVDLDVAKSAVRFSKSEATHWASVDLDERRRRVKDCLDTLRQHRELIALLLIWEIGKPNAQALTDIDRCIDGVAWYIDNVEQMLQRRKPLGLISNIASWNYPLSVLMHSVLVQTLAGNATISKTPTDGGLYALTLAHAIARRCGLPVSLVSGSGGQLSDALVRNEYVDCLAFVGGKTNGGAIAASLYDDKKRYMLEMEGVNTYGVWQFSDWSSLAAQLRKGFDYGKQRCSAS
jgi:acyl-CoA reductase-like NAD-dependent aldehyde dehydrogenase